jgi:membrane protease YdiL (CAAX protease family)
VLRFGEQRMTDGHASETDGRSGTVARAIATAGLLGFGGPLIALVLSAVILAGMESGLIPPLLGIVLVVIAGQYVAFGGLAIGYLRYRSMNRSDIREYLGVRVPSLRELLIVLGGWVLIFASIVVLSIIIQLTGAQPAENQVGEVARQAPAIIPVLVVVMFLVVGPSEEILFRGVVQGRLREALSPVPAILLASAIFAFVHWFALVGGSSGRLLTVAILFFPSLVFGAVYEYTDNLVVPALLHGLHNSGLLALFYLSLVLESQSALLFL